NALMVGDREHDIIGAKKNGIPSVGVLYGYGGPEEIARADPTYTAPTVGGLSGLLAGFSQEGRS
ncbi:MAG: HAD hydrolase-like protein, partial [Spirochaetales bacterium]|nr:HAD hydrolase-like protein [Spirochaetales bacterium]